MFLRCSYFSPNLSLDVLIDLVLIQNNACNSNFYARLCKHLKADLPKFNALTDILRAESRALFTPPLIHRGTGINRPSGQRKKRKQNLKIAV